jgi:hypothetical protein
MASHEQNEGPDDQVDPTAAEMTSSDLAEFLFRLREAGIRVRPDLRKEDHWVAAISNYRSAAYPSQKEAIFDALSWLMDEYNKQKAILDEVYKRHPQWQFR